jgi:hypothetical protein
MGNRRTFSYVLFILGILVFLLVGILAREWLYGILVGLICVIAAIIFYRRGK